MTLLVVEVAQVIPAADSFLNSANSVTIPLTFFDLPWLVFHPVKRVFFYRLTESTREHFHSFILPKLKLSLSLVLRNYIPLSSRITWDLNVPKPSIVVAQNDAVSMTVAETDSDFSRLSGYGQRPVSELHTLIPELPVSDDSATAFSLQVTLFPSQGFSIGFAAHAHHAVLDGKTASMFVKAWAHSCKQLLENKAVSLPESLTPSLDRSTLLKDLSWLDEKMIEIVRSLKPDKANERRSLTPMPTRELGDDVVIVTVVLSRGDVERLREKVKSESNRPLLHLSTFVIAYAYAWTCCVKARGGNRDRAVSFLFLGDFRERLDPPLPATYFGNCVFPAVRYNRKAGDFAEERGFVTAVEILSGLVNGLSSRKIETIAEEFAGGLGCLGERAQRGSVTGSTRLGFYETDFGWGKPVKTDVVSIGEGGGISMAERRDESGGLEMGMCLNKAETDLVLSIFNNGLQN
ncbi:unnamed protein product [Microthlaspi erraticum]|uniref:Uncharacterized protein n=1 Tax=Microthlaspi erraticum TaxID=1685480 RepID=A0A6D2HBB9_9BRAS|nr:unnamed protein product [Microthlaspi erraticum]